MPSRWWFLPWMSEAMAPPTVTCRVPGETTGQQPERHQGAHQPVEADAGLHRGPAPSQIYVEDAVEAGRDDHVATCVLGGVAVAAAQASGDDASRAGLLEGCRPDRQDPGPSPDAPAKVRSGPIR